MSPVQPLHHQKRPASAKSKVNVNVFVTSPWVPPEWIKAHQVEPRGIWTQSTLREMAPTAGVCAYAETVLRWAEREKSTAFVFTTHCDQLRRAFDALALRAPGRAFLFNLPATCGTPAAYALFDDELNRLSHWLIKMGGQPPEAAVLSQLRYNFDCARRQLIEAAAWCPARSYAEAVLRFHVEGRVELPSPSVTHTIASRADRVRLALVGGPFTPQYWPLLEDIERAGGSVVLNGTEAGERSLGAYSPGPSAKDELAYSPKREHLSPVFLNRIVDVFQRPNDRLLEWVRQRLMQRRVQGIVLWQFFGCDLWRAEFQTFRETFRLPVLMLEAEEMGNGLARSRVRLQAFLESLLPGPWDKLQNGTSASKRPSASPLAPSDGERGAPARVVAYPTDQAASSTGAGHFHLADPFHDNGGAKCEHPNNP